MAFTGRLGTPNSRFGNIVLGLSDGINLVGLDFIVHTIASNRVRVKFTFKVQDESALDVTKYILITSDPVNSIVPNIEQINFDDETHRSVILILDKPLTYNIIYSLQINGVKTVVEDQTIDFSRNFTSNVQDPPRAVGAFLSKRGFVDIIFDRSVGPTSNSAIFEICDSAIAGPGVAMTPTTWSLENLPLTTLRVGLPSGMPTASSFEIDFADVVDSSLNSVSDTVPVTLKLRGSAPYSYSELRQIQIIDALVSDVSNDLIETGTVRVYFNGPVLDANLTVNYSLTQDAPHKNTDVVDLVTSVDASDLPSLITLVNEVKLKINFHFTQSTIHFRNYDSVISAPNASDEPTSITLVNDIKLKYEEHLTQNRVHLFNDTLNILTQPQAITQLEAISLVNEIKLKYMAHIQEVYTINFSTEYPSPLNEITAYTRYDIENRAFDVTSAYTYYADLHVDMNSNLANINIEATVQSEDGLSITDPSNYTGSVKARSVATPAYILDKTISPGTSLTIQFDKDIIVQSNNQIEITNDENLNLPVTIKVGSTLPTLIWAFNNLVFAYSKHIEPSPVGAEHQVLDAINTITNLDYTELPLDSILIKVNNFKHKLNAHLQNSLFHYHADNEIVYASDATDLLSLQTLIYNIHLIFINHASKLGIHNSLGYRVLSAVLHDTISIFTDLMQDQQNHVLSGLVTHKYSENLLSSQTLNTKENFNSINLNESFIGLASRPSVASVIPSSGLLFDENGIKFGSDTVEVWFSKPMNQIPLSITNLIISGTINQKRMDWVSPVATSIEVSGMEAVLYNVSVIGLTDLAGNLVVNG